MVRNPDKIKDSFNDNGLSTAGPGQSNSNDQMMSEIEGYRLMEKLHESPRSVIYRGERLEDGASVVIKTAVKTSSHSQDMKRLEHEYAIAKDLNTKGTVKPLSMESYGSHKALILEHFPGITLASYLKTTPLTSQKLVSLAIKLAGVVDQVHQAGIVHGDINPSNFLIDPVSQTIKIIDFGLALRLDGVMELLHNSNEIKGTLEYISPEQTGRVKRTISHRSDLYSLGIVFYEMVTGAPPFKSNDPAELVYQHIARQPVLPEKSDLDPIFKKIILKLLSKMAEERYQSAQGVIYDLKRCAEFQEKRQYSQSFVLGSQDIPAQLKLSDHLFGRKSELAQLQKIWGDVFDGSCQKVLVCGETGIGKTSLLKRLVTMTSKKKRFVGFGAYEEQSSSVPYSALIQAFASIINSILSLPKKELDAIRADLYRELEGNEHIISNLFPDLTFIVDDYNPKPVLEEADISSRLVLVFKRFINALCSSDHPLVLVLDDLQWADSASMDLLNAILSDDQFKHFLFVGSHNSASLEALPDILKEDQLRYIPLSLLNESEIEEFLADSIDGQTDDIKQLAEIILKKTAGNPFYVTQFLRVIYQNGLLHYDVNLSGWRCDFEKIRGLKASDNVIDLMIDQYQDLSDESKRALQIASCLGLEFDLFELMSLLEASFLDLSNAISPALNIGFLELSERISNTVNPKSITCRFSNNRLRNKIYYEIDKKFKERLHYEIVQMLFKKYSGENQDDTIYQLINHYNRCFEMIHSEKELVELAELYVKAFEKSKTSAAFDNALEYSLVGLSLLPEDSWKTYPDITFKVTRAAAKAQYYMGNFSNAELLYEQALEHCTDNLDKRVEICIEQMILHIAQKHTGKVIEYMIQGLKLLGVEIPEDESQIEIAAKQEMQRLNQNLADKSMDDLFNAPQMAEKDRDKFRIIEVIVSGGTNAMYLESRGTLAKYLFRKMMNIVIEYGNCEYSGNVYCAFCTYVFMQGTTKYYEQGSHLTALALRLANERVNAVSAYKIYFEITQFVTHWNEHLRNCRPLFEKALDIGKKAGNLEHINNILFNIVVNKLMIGENIEEAYNDLLNQTDEFGRVKNFLEDDPNYRTTLQLFKNLLGRTNAYHTFSDADFDESDFAENHLVNIVDKGFFTFAKLIASVLNDDSTSSRPLMKGMRYMELLVMLPGTFFVPFGWFMTSELLADLIIETEAEEQNQHWQAFQFIKKNMKDWSVHCPDNFEFMSLTMEAEEARINGEGVLRDELPELEEKQQTLQQQTDKGGEGDLQSEIQRLRIKSKGYRYETIQRYKQAIEAAKASGFINAQAIIAERLAKFLSNHNFEELAIHYFRESYQAYKKWGVVPKIRQFKQNYEPYLQLPFDARIHQGAKALKRASQSIHTDILDLNTIIKASQTISGEVVSEQLIGKLLRLMMEHSGADNVVLIDCDEGIAKPVARFSAESDDVEFLKDHLSGEGTAYYPEGITDFVLRTNQWVVLEDARQNPVYSGDAYIQLVRPISVMCIPMMHSNRLIGLLYLENNLGSGTFTEKHREILGILVSQAAISFENARIYNDLTREIAERKQAEEQLRLNEQKYRIFNDNTDDVIWSFHRDKRLTLVSPSVEKHFGYTPDEFLALNAADYMTEEGAAQLHKKIEEILSESGPRKSLPFEIEVKQRRKDGSLFWTEIRANIQYDEKGEFLGFFGSTHDITERKEAEAELLQHRENLEALVVERTQELNETNKALQEAGAQMRSLIENSPDTIVMLDRNYVVQYMNKTVFTETIGDAVNRSVFDTLPKRFHQDVKERIDTVFATGEVTSYTTGFPMENGEEFWSETRFAPIKSNQEIDQILIVITDISEHKKAQKELKAVQQELVEKAHRAGMADIAANVLHNVGNILNSIKTSTHLIRNALKNMPIDDYKKANNLVRENMGALEAFLEQSEKVGKLFQYYILLERYFDVEHEQISENLKRLSDKVQSIADVITAQQSYAGTVSLTEKHRLATVIDDALTMHSGSIEQYGITIVKDIKVNPNISIQKTKLVHILINLFNNAKDAMLEIPKEERKLRISLERQNGSVLLKVSDSGKGIPPEQLTKIFTHGFTTKEDGHGFGLHSCANYMTEMGGEMWAESKGLGLGATFVMKFNIEEPHR